MKGWLDHTWKPYLTKDITLIEGVQQWTTKLGTVLVINLGLIRLEKIKIRSNFIETYK